jgi:hypothetical protein
MKLSNQSLSLINQFINNQYILPNIDSQTKPQKSTSQIIHTFYNQIKDGTDKASKLLRNKKKYLININKIKNVSELPIPSIYSDKIFPILIRKHIEKYGTYYIRYDFSLDERFIHVHFIVEEYDTSGDTYQTYIKNIIIWLYIVSKYSSKKCSKELNLYIYLTSLPKQLSNNYFIDSTHNHTHHNHTHHTHTEHKILDEYNINTAYTTTCPVNSEIVIFRKEEWFKVFIHETIHNFGLDFSDVNTGISHQCILSMFHVESDVNLFESYAEIWALLFNSMFSSYYFCIEERKNSFDQFLEMFSSILYLEMSFSFFQCVKILNYMNLTYDDILNNKIKSISNYKEKTNILSYYIIKLILLNNYEDFLLWCKENNSNILQFKKTQLSQEKYCHFIKKYYKSQKLFNCFQYMEEKYHNLFYIHNEKIKKLKSLTNQSNPNFLLNTTRMCIFELE